MECFKIEGMRADRFGGWLGALGLLRAAFTAGDQTARGWWDEEGVFNFSSATPKRQFVNWMAEHYRPTPIVAPWRRNAGYNPWRPSLAGVSLSANPKLKPFARAVLEGRRIVLENPAGTPPELLERCWNRLDGDAALWMTALYAQTEEGYAAFPFFLGGGARKNDFALRFAQEVMHIAGAAHGNARELSEALFSTPPANLEWYAEQNPWRFILAMEGTTTLARRQRPIARGDLRPPKFRFPFVFIDDAGEPEFWAPLWNRPAGWTELHTALPTTTLWVAAGGDGGARPAATSKEVATFVLKRGADHIAGAGFMCYAPATGSRIRLKGRRP